MTSSDQGEGVPEEGRSDLSEISEAPHSVIADVADLDTARLLIEDLEEKAIPAVSIELLGATTKDPRDDDPESDVAESDALSSLSKSAIVGGTLGVVIGAVLGLLMAYLIPDLDWPWGLLIGGVFGAGVGGAAGGMSVAKYSSPAWDETYQVEDDAALQVAVHHADADVVERAEQVMSEHAGAGVERIDRSR